MKKFETDQENFWANTFGNEYIDRNKGDQLLASNLNFFTKALKQTGQINSVLEFGANIGMNLQALSLLFPNIDLNGIEINTQAANLLKESIGAENVFNGSIFEYPIRQNFDLSLIKGVLIHINPDMLPLVYKKLYDTSNKYILVCEYYNPSPVTIPYRGHDNRLFKRDFAGELMDTFADLRLIDYGFTYHRDNNFPQDDINWFLLSK